MKLMLIIVLVLHALSIFSCSSVDINYPRPQGNETDKLALLAIKYQIQRDPNRVTSSWNESIPFCQWQGVTCSRRHRQRVTTLDLSSLALIGSISSHIGNLSFLRMLNLENNSFTGQIPPQIGHLHRLQVLDLNNNSFTGTIPANISYCFKLTVLDLGFNNLVGEIPPQLSSLSKLQVFLLQRNSLTGEIPPSLGNLSSLEKFGSSTNNLQGSIPSFFCQLRKLTGIGFGHNRLSGIIPPCIYNLSHIDFFELSGNQIQGSLPSNISNAFPNLQFFAVSNNQFTGAIPWSLCNAQKLVLFQCDGNQLTGQVPNLRNLHKLESLSIAENYLGSGKQGDLSFVSELTNATSLEFLAFESNNLGGSLPTSISNLSTKLYFITAASNHISGSLPTGLGNLFNLQLLVLGGNSFTGNIPSDIGKLSNLGIMYLDSNKLSGIIPYSLGNLTKLTRLALSSNNLEGNIPSSFGNFQRLEALELQGNSLNGTILPEIFRLTSLSTLLSISRNQISGSLPIEIGMLKNLGVLDVSYNMLSGQLPSTLSGCQILQTLFLQGNFFSGPIPPAIEDMRSILEIDLSRNNFSGDIPQFFEDMRDLSNLNLSFNQFSGAVPTGGIFRNASATSLIGNARLCGGIAEFKLPVCKSKTIAGGLSRRMKLMISLLLGLTVLGVVVVLSFFLVCKRKKPELSTLKNSFWQISYDAILKATDGFSSDNLIGFGAFGSVYKGILAENIVVAVKVFNMLHRGASKSFISECEVLRNIRHRNVVKVLTACSSIDFSGNDFKALIYEFMENGSLEDWLRSSTNNSGATEAPKRLTLIQRLDIAIDVASALDYLHNHCETQIVHCDLKPSNVLLDGDMTGHVSDFGLSKFLSDSTSVSRNHSSSIGIRGSVGYVAPEYGMGGDVSTYGDVYSFGILLLEIFTGKRPTDHMFNDNLNLHNHVKTTLRELVSEISGALVLQGDTTNVDEASMPIGAQKLGECLTLVLGIGIACSVESPTLRKDISDVLSELRAIRHNVSG